MLSITSITDANIEDLLNAKRQNGEAVLRTKGVVERDKAGK